MQTVIGNMLFTVSAHCSVHATLSRIGIATAYNSTIRQLHSLGLDKKAMLKTLGHAIVTGKVQVHLLYDNINQYHHMWRPNLTTRNALESRTASTVIVNRVDLKVFDGIVYHQCKVEHLAKEELTYDKLKSNLDADHLEGAAIANIARVLTKFVPELARLQSDVDNLQYRKHAKHCIKPERTGYHLLQCSSYDEAYTQGNCDVILDAFINQLGIRCKELEGRIFPVSGDQSTIVHVCTKRQPVKTGSLLTNGSSLSLNCGT